MWCKVKNVENELESEFESSFVTSESETYDPSDKDNSFSVVNRIRC